MELLVHGDPHIDVVLTHHGEQHLVTTLEPPLAQRDLLGPVGEVEFKSRIGGTGRVGWGARGRQSNADRQDRGHGGGESGALVPTDSALRAGMD